MVELEGVDGQRPCLPCVGAGPFHPPGGMVGGADPARHPGGGEFADRVDGLLDGCGAVLHVQPQHVDMVDPQPLQGAGECLVHRPTGEAHPRVRPRAGPQWLGADLGGDPDPVPHGGAGGEPAAKQSFGVASLPGGAGPEAVAVGGVDPAAATLDEPVQQGEGGVLVDGGPEEHGAENQRCEGPRLQSLAQWLKPGCGD